MEFLKVGVVSFFVGYSGADRKIEDSARAVSSLDNDSFSAFPFFLCAFKYIALDKFNLLRMLLFDDLNHVVPLSDKLQDSFS